jgi:hypothetical protein
VNACLHTYVTDLVVAYYYCRNIATGGTFTALPKEALASLQVPSPSVSEKITPTPGAGEFIKDWAAGVIPDDMYAYDSDR